MTDYETLELPVPGSKWRHHSGRVYQVLFVANEMHGPLVASQDTLKYPLTIVYRGENGNVWAGRADDWHRRMTAVKGSNTLPDGKKATVVSLSNPTAKDILDVAEGMMSWLEHDRAELAVILLASIVVGRSPEAVQEQMDEVNAKLQKVVVGATRVARSMGLLDKPD